MRRTKRGGGFFLCLLLNVLLNWEGAIPAALLLALHRWRGWPLWWAGLALALWIGGLIVWMLVIAAIEARMAEIAKSGAPIVRREVSRDEARENKNPYSAKQYPNSGSAADKKTE